MSDASFEIIEARNGENVTDFATRVLALARLGGITVLGQFNQHTFEATPDSLLHGVLQPYEEWMRESYRQGGDV